MSKKTVTKKTKSKKTKSYLFQEVMDVLTKNHNKMLNYKQIAAQLNISDDSQKLLINHILEDLKNKEYITEPERGKFKIKPSDRYLIGTVDMTASGAAFVMSEDSEEDIYISPRKTLNALHGDTVKVYVYPKRKTDKKEGEIAEIVKRAKLEFVGIVQLSPKYAFLIPDNTKMHTDIYIPLENINGARDGQKAIARILDWPKNTNNPIGEIIDVLGEPGVNEVEMHAILAEFGLPYSFPKDVEKIADRIPTNITQQEIDARRDFRDITTFTIDPVDAKDFDDAISFAKLPNGNYEIGVHIADVTHYVKEGSVIDQEALERATSVYLVDRVVPMLPEILSNNVCSLRPQEEKLCFSAVFEMDEEANVLHEWFGRTIIFSDRRFTYEEAQLVIETGEGDFSEEILILDKLAKKLRKERFKKGSIAFDKLEVKFHLDEAGNPTGVFFKETKDSNQLIEDFMLLANRKVAEFVGKRGKRRTESDKKEKKEVNPFVYRVHDSPSEEKLNSFSEFVKKFGYKINTKSDKALVDSMNTLLKEVSGKPMANTIEQLAIRTMAKAIYTTKNIGHYGLGFDFYTHFTSPIRRYPDVMVHRLLQYYLDKENGKRSEKLDAEALEQQCKHSSDREKLAAEAERSSIKYKQVQYLQEKVGEKFEGFISGVTEWGIYVELKENHCEGMVRLRDIRDDMYTFDEENFCIRGRRTGKVYTLGDTVKIEIKRADLIKKQLDFILITD